MPITNIELVMMALAAVLLAQPALQLTHMGGVKNSVLSCPPQAPTTNTGLGGGESLSGSALGVLPEVAPTFGWLKTALDDLTLVAMNNTAILQQLMAANLALPTTIATLTATNKRLVDVVARGKEGGTPLVTPTNPSRGVQGTWTPFPGNYCWTHGHCCKEHHINATCGN
jgi:hypothetical protein